jgi:hypothetical protein
MPDNWYYAFNELTDMLVVYGVSLYNNSSPAVCLCWNVSAAEASESKNIYLSAHTGS